MAPNTLRLERKSDLQDGIDEVLGANVVDTHEILPVQTLGNTCGMHHIVEVVAGKRLHELVFR